MSTNNNSEKPQADVDISAEFAELGKKLRTTVETAWQSQERQKVQREIQDGLVKLRDELDKTAKSIRESETGQKVATVEAIQLAPKRLLQIGSLYEKYAPSTRQGYLQVIQTSGANPFVAYSVINDGSSPGQRTGDGAFLSSSP